MLVLVTGERDGARQAIVEGRSGFCPGADERFCTAREDRGIRQGAIEVGRARDIRPELNEVLDPEEGSAGRLDALARDDEAELGLGALRKPRQDQRVGVLLGTAGREGHMTHEGGLAPDRQIPSEHDHGCPGVARMDPVRGQEDRGGGAAILRLDEHVRALSRRRPPGQPGSRAVPTTTVRSGGTTRPSRSSVRSSAAAPLTRTTAHTCCAVASGFTVDLLR